jgi:hypothetical protein
VRRFGSTVAPAGLSFDVAAGQLVMWLAAAIVGRLILRTGGGSRCAISS